LFCNRRNLFLILLVLTMIPDFVFGVWVMRKHIGLTALTISLLALVAAPALAADQDEMDAAADGYESGKFYGNLRLNTVSYIDEFADEEVISNSLGLGLKIGYDGATSPWGYQFDIDTDYFDSSLMVPTPSVTGDLLIVESAAHVTLRTSSHGKFGAYAGLSHVDSGYAGAGYGETRSYGFGIEGLKVMNESTWVQGRVGIFDPFLVDTDGSGSEVDLIGDAFGGTIGASVHHAWSSNISTRVGAGVTYVNVADGKDQYVLTLGGAGNYTFDQMPLSLGVNAGYTEYDLGDTALGGFALGTSIAWSFGGPSEGSTGKLFNSGITSFGF
jgi:hypothetical protein